MPWSPVNPNHTEINAAEADADPNSVFHHERTLIALRHEPPVVALGDFAMLPAQDQRVYAFNRSLDGVALLVLGDFSAEEAPVHMPDAVEWTAAELLLENDPDPDRSATGLVLRPWEARVDRRD